ncbi:Alanine--tRNA ligase [Trichinella spiralis]|uniref:Alanine--tRNA ligase n=1 Tax=Trichinella spiralis TaxID=6334 RepID=A0ABR3KIL0_TRISP
MFGISFTVKVGVTGMRGWVGGSVERIEAITEKGHYEMPAGNACLQKKRANKILMVAQPMNGRFAVQGLSSDPQNCLSRQPFRI